MAVTGTIIRHGVDGSQRFVDVELDFSGVMGAGGAEDISGIKSELPFDNPSSAIHQWPKSPAVPVGVEVVVDWTAAQLALYRSNGTSVFIVPAGSTIAHHPNLIMRVFGN